MRAVWGAGYRRRRRVAVSGQVGPVTECEKPSRVGCLVDPKGLRERSVIGPVAEWRLRRWAVHWRKRLLTVCTCICILR